MIYNNKFFKYATGALLMLTIIFLLGKIDFILIPLRRILGIIFLPFLIGGLFYYILRPLVRLLEKGKVKRTGAILLVFLAVILLLTAISMYGGAFIKKEFMNFYRTFTRQLEVAQRSTSGIFEKGTWSIFTISDVQQRITSFLEYALRNIGENIVKVLSTAANIGALILLVPFVVFYLLKDGELFIEQLMKIIPSQYHTETKKLLGSIDKTLSTYITGQLMVALVIGVLMYIGYLLIGLPNALVLAFFAMITAIIPFVGPFIGVAPAIFIGLTTNFMMVVKVLVVMTVVQQLEGNFVSPNVIGNRLDIHPLTVIFLIMIAISLFGVIGAFVVIPLYAIVKVILHHRFKFGGCHNE